MQTDDFTIKIAGINLACRRLTPPPPGNGAMTGNGSGESGPNTAAIAKPAIIFLHEALGSIRMWRDFPARLATASGHEVIIYERRGHGSSDPHGPEDIPRPLDFHNIEADLYLDGVINALGLRRPILFGHSDGATIALKYAARFPDRLSGVISEAAHVMIEDVTRNGIEDAARLYAQSDWKTRLARHHGEQTDAVFRAWVDTWRHHRFRGWDMRDELPAITCPSLIIQGDDDAYGSDDQVDAICSGVRGPTRKMIIPQCGHIPHFDQPDQVIAACLDFLGIPGDPIAPGP